MKFKTINYDDISIFNDKQQLMISTEQFPILTIAGPGSGKTATLTAKIASQLVTNLIDFEKILLLTFTNNAAGEIVERVEQKTGLVFDLKDYYAGTFHSVFFKFIKEFSSEFFDFSGFKKYPRIIDENEEPKLFFDITKSKLDPNNTLKIKNFKFEFQKSFFYTPIDVYFMIAEEINKGPSGMNEIINNILKYKFSILEDEDKKNMIKNIIIDFIKEKIRLNVVSYNDILFFTYIMLKKYPDVRKIIQEKFNFVLVDEYQDTNPIQSKILELVGNNNECFIGDPYQSIYGFLGASVENIVNKVLEPNINTIQFNINYRSTENIVSLTNDLVTLFNYQIPNFERCISGVKELKNNPIKILEHHFFQESAIIRDIKTRLAYGIQPCEIAVLARTNRQLYVIEKQLLKYKMPYVKKGGSSYFDLPEVNILIQVLKIISGEFLPYNLNKVAGYFDKLGKVTIDKVILRYTDRKIKSNSIWTIIEKDFSKQKHLQLFKKYFYDDFEFTFQHFLNLLNVPEFNIKSKMVSRGDTLTKQKSIDNNMADFIQDISKLFEIDEEDNIDNPQEVIIERINNFLAELNLNKNMKETKSDDKIVLSTVHAAKGLEWDSCFIMDATEGIFPYIKDIDKQSYPYLSFEEIIEIQKKLYEEEKRLFYVAVSRAKSFLALYSKTDICSFIEPFLDKPYFSHNNKNNNSNKSFW